MSNSIGGFIGLELPKCDNSYHKQALALTTGRASLSLILENISPQKVFLPFYCCDSLISPLIENGIEIQFYGLNSKLEIDSDINLSKGEYIIYINYFGIKSSYVSKLIREYGEKLILDNTQAFFEKTTEVYSFNSARKFFGVPDGSFLYGKIVNGSIKRNKTISLNHLVLRLEENLEQSYKEYVAYENGLTNEVMSISHTSNMLLSCINYQWVKDRRVENFKHYQNIFLNKNILEIDFDISEEVPLCYPLMVKEKINKEDLYKNRLFVPTYWDDVIERNIQGFSFEKSFAQRLIPLPVDQRYTESDIDKASKIVLKFIK